MRVANISGRATVLVDGFGVDVERASAGRFPSELLALLEQWDDFRAWADEWTPEGGVPVSPTDCGPPVPRPRQIFAGGKNYRGHATEIGLELPSTPYTFTKFPTSVVGPYADVTLHRGNVDWEVELVVVIGRAGHRIPAEQAWPHVAGLAVGQDLSQRELQLTGPPPQQFSLAKSYPGFCPYGPALVTPDEVDDPDDLMLGCAVNGEEVEKAMISEMVFSVPELIARISSVVMLLPGDLIFTGTPAGVGMGLQPPRFLAPGDELVSYVEGIGKIRTRLRAG